jgi:hypothetical protein
MTAAPASSPSSPPPAEAAGIQRPGVGVIKLFIFSPTKRQNKLECLSLASFFEQA